MSKKEKKKSKRYDHLTEMARLTRLTRLMKEMCERGQSELCDVRNSEIHGRGVIRNQAQLTFFFFTF